MFLEGGFVMERQCGLRRYSNTIRKQYKSSITYRPFPTGCGGPKGIVTPEDIVIGTFNYAEQNGYLKMLVR